MTNRNVGELERIISTVASALLGTYGATRRGVWKMPWLAASAAFAKRGITGKCELYSALGINTADKEPIPAQKKLANSY